MAYVVSGVTNAHSQWLMAATRHPVGVTTGECGPARTAPCRSARRRGLCGAAGERARRHLQAERGPQHVGDLCQRYAHLGVQLDDQRHDAGAQLRTGRAQRIRGLQRVAALHAPLTPRAWPTSMSKRRTTGRTSGISS